MNDDDMDWTWQTEKTISECLELQQGLFSCALCFRTKRVKPHSIIVDGWRECCGKKMNLVPAGGRIRNEKHHFGNNTLYVTSLSRS